MKTPTTEKETNKLLAEIRDAIKDATTTRHRDTERLIEQIAKLRDSIGGRDRTSQATAGIIGRPRDGTTQKARQQIEQRIHTEAQGSRR